MDYGTSYIQISLLCPSLGHYATSWKVAGSGPDEMIEFFSIDLILLATLGPGFTQPLTEMNTRSRKCFWGVERGWCIGLTTLSPSVSWLSRQCGILNISQLYRPPPVTGIAFLILLFFLARARLNKRHNRVSLCLSKKSVKQGIGYSIKSFNSALAIVRVNCTKHQSLLGIWYSSIALQSPVPSVLSCAALKSTNMFSHLLQYLSDWM
jgi:hypothetical protein